MRILRILSVNSNFSKNVWQNAFKNFKRLFNNYGTSPLFNIPRLRFKISMSRIAKFDTFPIRELNISTPQTQAHNRFEFSSPVESCQGNFDDLWGIICGLGDMWPGVFWGTFLALLLQRWYCYLHYCRMMSDLEVIQIRNNL